MIPDDCSLLEPLCNDIKQKKESKNEANAVPYIMIFTAVLILSFFFLIVKPTTRSQCSHALMCSTIMAVFITFVCTLLYSKVT